jgi:hypothetical protein
MYMCAIPNGFRDRAISLYSSLVLATAAVEEYRGWFSVHRNPDGRVVFNVFSTLCERGTLRSARVSSERARQQHVEEQETFLEILQRRPTISTRRLSERLGVSRTRVQ